jgi:hypothetical protein
MTQAFAGAAVISALGDGRTAPDPNHRIGVFSLTSRSIEQRGWPSTKTAGRRMRVISSAA